MSPARNSPGRPAGEGGVARAALLAAARRHFALRGYGGATLKDIVAEANASFPTLYHHFGSKAGLYVAVATEVNDLVLGAFANAAADHASVAARVDALLRVTVTLQASDPTIANFVMYAPVDFALHPELAVASGEMHRLRSLVEELASGDLSAGVTRADAIRTITVLIFGLSRVAVTATPAEYRRAALATRRLARKSF